MSGSTRAGRAADAARIPERAQFVALTRTGRGMSSTDLAGYLQDHALHSTPEVCFVVGGAFGLGTGILDRAQRQRVQRERDVMAQKPRENKATEGREKVPERWSAQQKTEVVLRLLRGEDLVEVSREVQVSPPELEEWRRVFLETGQQGLRRRGRDPGERELTRTRAKLGELTMRLELARELLEKRGYGDELEKLLKRGRG